MNFLKLNVKSHNIGAPGFLGTKKVLTTFRPFSRMPNIPQKIEINKEKGKLTIQCDEMVFCSKQKNKQWIWLALDQNSNDLDFKISL